MNQGGFKVQLQEESDQELTHVVRCLPMLWAAVEAMQVSLLEGGVLGRSRHRPLISVLGPAPASSFSHDVGWDGMAHRRFATGDQEEAALKIDG